MAQAERGKRTAISALQAGDFIAWENNGAQRGADHIALYLGDGMILEAPRTGLQIRIRKLSASEMSGKGNAWGVKLDY
ncbi:Peptidoglycan endopeptidase RipA precursor [compost metagenome]